VFHSPNPKRPSVQIVHTFATVVTPISNNWLGNIVRYEEFSKARLFTGTVNTILGTAA